MTAERKDNITIACEALRKIAAADSRSDGHPVSIAREALGDIATNDAADMPAQARFVSVAAFLLEALDDALAATPGFVSADGKTEYVPPWVYKARAARAVAKSNGIRTDKSRKEKRNA
jgi:hypothetical protein